MNLHEFKTLISYFQKNCFCHFGDTNTYPHCKIFLDDPTYTFTIVREGIHDRLYLESSCYGINHRKYFKLDNNYCDIIGIMEKVKSELLYPASQLNEKNLYFCTFTIIEYYEKILGIEF